MNPLRGLLMLMVAGVIAAFFIVLGRTGSLIAALLTTAPAWGLLTMAGMFERFDPRIGVPLFRWALWAGTYVEPPIKRTCTCPTCGGRGRVAKEK